MEGNWREEPLIATVSPVEQGGKIVGFVFMFQDIKSVHALIDLLNKHFLLAGLISVSLTILMFPFPKQNVTLIE